MSKGRAEEKVKKFREINLFCLWHLAQKTNNSFVQKRALEQESSLESSVSLNGSLFALRLHSLSEPLLTSVNRVDNGFPACLSMVEVK